MRILSVQQPFAYANIVDDIDNSTSIWANPADHQWVIGDAYLFDEPITNVKGKLNLWNYTEIDENNLPPAHKWSRRAPKLNGTELEIPVSEEYFEESIENGSIDIEFSLEIIGLVVKENNEFKPIETLKLVSPSNSQTFKVISVEEMCYQYDNCEDVTILNQDYNEVFFTNLRIKFE